MSKIFTFLIILFTVSILKAGDFYFYKDTRTDLTPHKDRIAVVFNDDLYTSDYRYTLLKNAVSSDNKIVNVDRNIFLIRSTSGRELSLDNLKSNRSLAGLIKFVTPVYYLTSKHVMIIPADEFIVRLKNINDKEKLDHLNILNGITIVGNVGSEKGFLLKTLNGNSKTSLELANLYHRESFFDYAEPNFYYPEGCLLLSTPNDPLYSSQWALNNTGQTVNIGGLHVLGDATTDIATSGSDMRVSLAWDNGTGNSSIKIGIFDTGIDSTHPDLRASIGGTGYDSYYNIDGVPRDSNGHGTNCAGLIGATYNNSTGVAGIAPGCKIYSYKIYNASGTTNDIIIARALDTAVARGIWIYNNSWGGIAQSSTLDNAINNAYVNSRGGLGGVILFASGNDGYNPPEYPASLPAVITIGASTPHDQKKAPGTGNEFYWGSNYGGNLSAIAPTNCYTTDIQGAGGNDGGDYYETFGGTSASCANGTGVAALVLSVNTSLTTAQVRDFLVRGSEKVDNVPYNTKTAYGRWNEYYGYGRLNAYYSVMLASGVDKTPPTINHLNVSSVNSTYPVNIAAEIIDQDTSTVDTTTNKPKIFYRINKNNAGWSSYDSSSFSSKSGNNYVFKMPGQGWETQVQYYLKAYDVSGNSTVFPKHAPDSLCICYYKIGDLSTYTDVFPSFAILDLTYNQSSNISLPSFDVLDTKIDVYARHTYDGDFELTLYSPNGNSNRNRKCIEAFNGYDGVNIIGASVNDTNSSFWINGSPPYTGENFKPDYPFRGLNGINASGNWSVITFDRGFMDVGTVDSIRMTLLRTTGSLSPDARLDSPADSTVDFDTASVVTVRDFYVRNKGTSNLSITSINFTGLFSSKFTLVNSPSLTIVPSDSSLFRVQYDPAATEKLSKKDKENSIDLYENAKMELGTNDPSKPVFKVSLLNNAPLPVEMSSFTSEVTGRNVMLNWSTISEHNNSGFDIEYKIAQENITESWVRYGSVDGAGNSDIINSYRFSVSSLNAGRYNLRLKQIDFNGNFKYFYLINEVVIGLPAVFYLEQNYPNPFNPVTNISYGLPVESNVSIKVFNIQGREVFDHTERKQAGYYILNFNASALSSGIYFYRLVAESANNKFTAIKKMVFVK